jgi:hypothetical protein
MPLSTELVELIIDGRAYAIEVLRRKNERPDAPRLIIISHMINDAGRDILRACLDGVRYFTSDPHEVWVVDNNSPRENLNWLFERDEINLALNRVEPFPPDVIESGFPSIDDQKQWGSYANAIGLEIGIRLIDQSCRYVMTMHMDTFPCDRNWLSFLSSKIDGRVKAAGVRLDRARDPEGVLHVLGYMVDFQMFRKMKLDFFPELPKMDVGDKVTILLREAGYKVFSCQNTLWEPELDNQIPITSPLKGFRVDRAFDEEGNIIFLHLGRGVRKSTGDHTSGVSLNTWLDLIYNSLIGTASNPLAVPGISRN